MIPFFDCSCVKALLMLRWLNMITYFKHNSQLNSVARSVASTTNNGHNGATDFITCVKWEENEQIHTCPLY